MGRVEFRAVLLRNQVRSTRLLSGTPEANCKRNKSKYGTERAIVGERIMIASN